MVAGVLSSGLAPADLQAALYRAAAKLPGIKLIDSAANLDGRHGVAIGHAGLDENVQTEIIFNQSNGQFIGEREVLLRKVEPRPLPSSINGHKVITVGSPWGNAPVGTTLSSTALTVSVVNGDQVPTR